MDVFRGTDGLPLRHYRHTGNGLGGILSGLARSIMPVLAPILKKGAKFVGKQLLSSGVGIANDLLSGKKLKSSLSTRGKEAAKNVLLKATTTKEKNPVTRRQRKPKRAPKTQPEQPRRKRKKHIKVHQLSEDILG
jgi:hypothetical protein